jgi:hypothetical protein
MVYSTVLCVYLKENKNSEVIVYIYNSNNGVFFELKGRGIVQTFGARETIASVGLGREGQGSGAFLAICFYFCR